MHFSIPHVNANSIISPIYNKLAVLIFYVYRRFTLKRNIFSKIVKMVKFLLFNKKVN